MKGLNKFQRSFAHLGVLFAGLRGMLETVLDVLHTLLPLHPPDTPVMNHPQFSLQREVSNS